MYCEKCGSKNEMTSDFCTNCGNKLNKELSNTNVNNTTVINTEEEKNTFFHFGTDIVFSDRITWFITLIFDDAKL